MNYTEKAKRFWSSSYYRKRRSIMTAIFLCGLGTGYIALAFISLSTEGVNLSKALGLACFWTLFMLIGWGLFFFIQKYVGPLFWEIHDRNNP